MKLPKYCTQIGKSLYFQRRFPLKLSEHPSIGGRANYKVKLKSNLNDPVALAKELEEVSKSFDSYIQTLTLANEHVLNEVDLHNRAEAFLKMHNLKKGMLAIPYDESDQDDLKQSVLELGHFDELDHHLWHNDPKKRIPYLQKPNQLVKVQQYAWKLLNTPITAQPRVFLLSDCWNYYCDFKGIHDLNRDNNRSHKPWNRFVSLGGGDTIITQETVDNYLDIYTKERLTEVSKATVTRELSVVIAALRLMNRDKRLKLNITKPTLTQKHESKPKPALTHAEQIRLIKHASDSKNSCYKPWKELFILLAIQSGAHAKELKTLTDKNLHLDHEIPYITLNSGDGEGKTTDRPRYIPIVLHLGRIKELINSGALEELKKRSTDNISNQIKKLMTPVLENSSAYSLRHTLKHNCDIAGVDSSVTATLGGWSGKQNNLSQHMLGYGRASKETTDRLRSLQKHQLLIMAHTLR